MDEASEEFDCLSCGACCRGAADGRVPVAEIDLVRWRRAQRPELALTLVPGHFGLQGLPALSDGSCAHHGTSAHPHACAIYELRPDACRALEPGSSQCRAYRREFHDR